MSTNITTIRHGLGSLLAACFAQGLAHGLATVAMASLAPASAQSQGPGHQLVTPPVESWFEGRAIVPTGVDPDLTMSVVANTTARTVTVTWNYSPKDLDWTAWCSIKQDYSTSFWPTCVTARGDNTFYIAGMRTDQGTRIEAWSFPVPTLDTSTPTIAVGQRSSVSLVLSEKNSSRSVPTHMCSLRGPTSGATPMLLVQFFGDKSLWSLNETSGLISELASPDASPPAGVTSIPKLNQDFAGLVFRDHKQFGYVYVFTFVAGEGHVDDDAEGVVLYDQDRDGQLDGHFVLDAEGWKSYGFHLSSNYND